MTTFFRGVSLFCWAAVTLAFGATESAAQWGSSGRYDAPPYGQQQPVYGQNPAPYGQSQQQPPYGQPYGAPPSASTYGNQNPRCRDLEAQLAGGGANTGQDQLPRIDADMRNADMAFRRAQSDADRSDCYEDMFLFGKTLRRTPRCLDLDRQVQEAKANLTQLKSRRDAIVRGSAPRARHDDIVADLARNRCGDQYAREYDAQRRRDNSIFSFFSNEEDSEPAAPRSTWTTTPTYGGASTYRTLCVRECDGFYYPISTATSESQFPADAERCQSQCASPAELYYHRSDQDVDQMVSLSGRLYVTQPFAFRNRKVFVKGCSCKATEYSREEIAKFEETQRTSKRADASGSKAGKSAVAPAPAAPTTAPSAGGDPNFAQRISQAVQNAPATPPAKLPSTPQAVPSTSSSVATDGDITVTPIPRGR
ncbi:hypothetical protein Rvan_1672 [Rhodomicrobium vannielii ATCC 17100]|uniref:DUF2865 domain-containing protein n=1 Tax=Rhodomicrobium vannielii (strain ATCC 17100 / DSM 162 / LMG 4299 / NCIMB 10020 / ATH 3.1.1) TaxID=648757 RepID=E3I8L2_RHOVT|nr:DUF2865 domain-containing protein [Rhodomicrobium vannielii]ADP70921.1 hypothetical protein Rvan_1672 [Rhodomicrobium vannielii ATCC 17100]